MITSVRNAHSCMKREDVISPCKRHSHIKSRAAYILLVKKLLKKSENIFSHKKWLKVRHRYLMKVLNCNGRFWCEYCGKADLREESTSKNTMVTVDHFVPIAEGGLVYDENNFVISCCPCNTKYNDMPSSQKIIQYPIIKP